jgi:ferrous iron transport protein A
MLLRSSLEGIIYILSDMIFFYKFLGVITMIKKLNELKSGESGTLVSYGSGGDLELKRHLLGMGFVKGADVEVEKVAPLGDPMQIKVKGYSVCLRKEEAKNIEIEV